jgi:cysteinyl-tRNA synthetase
VTVGGQKMSKSLFNFILAEDVLRERDPLVVRYALGAAHYRSSLDITESTFDEAESALDRIRTFLSRAARSLAGGDGDLRVEASVPDRFAAALDDDLGVPQALAVIHETVRDGNAALDAGDRDAVLRAFGEVAVMTGILGIDPEDPRWTSGSAGPEAAALDALVQTMITQRADARAAKDWAAADRIRDAVAAAGIALEDSATGTRWSIERTPSKEN